jgi:branched-chain amino acid transport system permease protein
VDYVNAVIHGLALGAVYGLVGLGYTVVYKATRIVNLAQGDLLMVGALLSYWLMALLHWPWFPALLAVIVMLVVLALIEERLIIRPFVGHAEGGASALGWLVSTLAFGLVIETVAVQVWGNKAPTPVPSPISAGSLRIGQVYLPWQSLAPLVVLVVLTLALHEFYRRTQLGRAMRAAADDPELASIRAIDPRRISRAALVIAGVIAALSGFVLGPIVNADPSIGLEYGLTAFVALAVGGFGSIPGTLLGAAVLGVVQDVAMLKVSGEYTDVITLVLLLVVLMIRPNGLLTVSRMRSV